MSFLKKIEAQKALSKKQLDKMVEQAYYKQGRGVQINIMDIGKLFKDVSEAYLAGQDLDEAVKEAIKKYRQN